MTKINTKTILVFSLMLAGFFMVDLTSTNNLSNLGLTQSIYSADGNLSNWNVSIDKDEVNRAIETVSISFTDEDHNSSLPITFKYYANITLSNGSELNVTLNNASNIWSGTYTPAVTTPVGQANITILKVNIADETVLNAATLTLDAFFEIKNNHPNIGVQLNATEVFRGDEINMLLTPFDVEDSMGDLEWAVGFYDSTNALVDPIRAKGDEPKLDYDYTIPSDINTGAYYINATCWDSEDNVTTVEYPITVLDNTPVIDAYLFEIDGVEQTGAISVLRDSVMLLKVNVSDADYDSGSEDLLLSISAKDAFTGESIFPGLYTTIALNEAGWNFTKNITFNADISTGYTLLTMRVYQEGDTSVYSEFTQAVTVLNNAPEISEYQINEKTPSEQKTFTEGDIITFTFNVTDVEDGIDYIKVDIIYVDTTTNAEETISYIVPYEGSTTSLSIRTVDLSLGTFTAWVYVYDDLGAFDKFDEGNTFEIVEGETIQPITWLISVAAFILGGAIALGISYSIIKPSVAKKTSSDDNSTTDDDVMTTSDEVEEEVQEDAPKSDQKTKKKKLIRKL
ncbi:hypothetical protein NEF87_002898 [Candidatus Lokiarchaeum ossiferum]|uniref:CARDB domain-containing protein n=1 Tax=Candidatus Lokiarchaeum ossiferum TaxID=2951803 RepID=A0ABY6HSX6_9ARCH|nr:hypothetical protein NEF87_002898 [Candidatus Lokiarchaeum sp. B-35]